MSRGSQDGLAWEETLFDLVPRWTREPSIEAIERTCRQKLNIGSEDTCAVSMFASGAFNKLFMVTYADQSALMRVSLPVYPHIKTRSEAATLRWVRENTKVPVPQVLAFEDSNDNEIGFEWILMDLIPGSPAHKRWRTMSMKQKEDFTTKMVEFQADLFRLGRPESTFSGIGTLNFETKEQDSEGVSTSIIPGELVSHSFFMGDHLHYDVARGPFLSSYDWLSSELKIIILEQETVIEKAEDEDDKEDAEEILTSARKLLSLLPKIFSPTQPGAEATVIYHDDLNLWNILVDSQGSITAVVDWECVSALPIWMATRMPKFLTDSSREEEPKRDEYMDETASDSAEREKSSDPNLLDNEGKDDLYWIHRMEWEVTQLRKVYSTKMRELWPDWPLEESNLKVDFYEAVLQCAAGIFLKQVDKWADGKESGQSLRLTDV
ncbi:hypothetical protein PFICI_02935 [Pestalotiopsis fici W106-1]|uniref:Aminoglycoside phosphotransferase domain-containing protein n=1 Tax=Pestalotiopsis fici (strain W106-1 / CGMCC3.15140) TaxID=1229662 RepID=W3XFV1_PESFW|nr:uncharacterized protein PFICI_02935 [Pestalotiopsis fici W106-1]ETS84910.1 hypothetical protein PFICI_02935 [Pestalotiopsis fici W106-1]